MSGTMTVDALTATIGAGQSLSDAVPTNGRTPLWISTPAGMAGTVLTFVAVGPGGDEVLRDADGVELQITLGAAGSRHSLMPTLSTRLAGHQAIKVRSVTAGSPAPQVGAVQLILGLRQVL